MVDNSTEIFDKELEEYLAQATKRIKVIGCGGGGSNTISTLYNMNIEGPELIAINTDVRHLLITRAHKKILVGKQLTKGLGAGKDPKIGEEAAKESEQEIKKAIEGSDVIFLTCGLGGGSGGGVAPVVAEVAKKLGSIVIAICTWPFSAEGSNIWDNALYSLERLEKNVDLLVIIPNDKLQQLYPNIPLMQAFKVADSLLSNALRDLTELLTKPGYINVDFADFRSIVSNAGYGIFGIGESNSENKATEAVQRALNNPLIDVDATGAKAALVRVVCSPDVTPADINKILDTIKSVLDPRAKLIQGISFEDDKKNYVKVSITITKLKNMPSFILGIKTDNKPGVEKPEEQKKIENELGIEVI
ncbi:cell division protein FtsZ [Nanobdella aerobiophila]|uniref:Cell division protein FtsZ n=1 Tax=Nanobdella aerobiophila TaxID=2586965 RepID=A0A915WSK7_9ARCH|nr:cell division protein FtsZ [Nanobdella aerobiophila]BBL45312.1 cell division protein FtsZ [Nanobdella aerobiophila]